MGHKADGNCRELSARTQFLRNRKTQEREEPNHRLPVMKLHDQTELSLFRLYTGTV